ncbi:MAG TPA: site-specific DNA-methyltransferase [Acidimicrobiales bacterium]|nr:site-specific DNA-methyltransferase [Acidimicrobiales bacterium]
MNQRRRGTTTSRFGVGRRENHDSAEFYRRFKAPVISDADDVAHPSERPIVDAMVHGDIRQHPEALAPSSVALVVTSPPYYSGKEYETAIGQGHVPASYEAYLGMLHGVFAQCVDALEAGGRIAVNVANLGRKPYRSLSRDVIDVFEDLGLLLRGEVVWQKARGAAGNCAWGTYQKPGDPVLRDLTERVIVASKGRFDRALDPRARLQGGYPSEASIYRDEFLEATTDLWEMAPESANRVNHPAPFPVELPQRLIELYTYRDDLVVDPFMGSGSTAIAALRTDRRFVGFDTDLGYVAAATARVEAERERLAKLAVRRPALPAVPAPVDPAEDFQERSVREGRRARELAKWALEAGGDDGAGFTVTAENKRLEAGVEVDFVAVDRAGRRWLFDVYGAFTTTPAGLRRSETLWKALGKAAVLQHVGNKARYVLLTTGRPARNSAGGRALDAVTGPDPRKKPVFDVVDLRAPEDLARLRSYGRGRAAPR